MALTKVSRGLLSTGIVDNSNATAITIDSSENVGIGTSSPTTLLELKSTSATAGLSITGSNAHTSDINMGDTDDINIQRIRSDHSNNSLQFTTNNAERLRIDSSGAATFSSRVNVGGTVLATGAALVNSTSAGGFGFASNNTAFYSFGANTSTAGSYTFQNLSSNASVNVTSLSLSSTGAVFNEGSVDADFRIESNGNANMLFVNGGANTVNIGNQVGKQTLSHLNVRNNCAAIEFGHENTSSGFFGTLGAFGNNGHPYIGFSTACDAVNQNTFSTYGVKGSLIKGDTSGNLIFAQVTTASATGQTPIEIARIGPSEMVINDGGLNYDFRVESDTNTHALFVDGATGKVNLAGAAGSSGAPNLAISMSNSDAFNHAVECLNPNLTANEVILSLIGFAASTKNSGYMGYKYSGSGSSNNNLLTFGHYGADHLMTINGAGAVVIAGSLSKGSGSFKIDHPLEAKKDTHHLVHSFIEGPQADNIYRGKVNLVEGSATVNIDTVSGMSEGTYVLLNTNTQCFTSNESGWTAVKGSVSGNILTITAQESCTDTISWMVVGERHDQHMLDTEWTDGNGKVIVEPLKELES